MHVCWSIRCSDKNDWMSQRPGGLQNAKKVGEQAEYGGAVRKLGNDEMIDNGKGKVD